MVLRVFLALVFCAVAVVAGRFIAHTVAPSGATAHGYAVGSSASSNATPMTTLLSPVPVLTASPLVLSPRPTRAFILPTTQPLSTQATTASTESSTRLVTTSTRIPSVTPSSSSSLTVTPAGAYFAYTVKKGDTLNDIAKSFNTSAKAILAINTIDDSDALKIGQVIHIPAPN